MFLQPFDERRETRMYGRGLHPGEEAAKALGVDAVLPRSDFAGILASKCPMNWSFIRRSGQRSLERPRPAIREPAASATKSDPWDGRISREEFVQKLKGAGVQSDVKDLDPIINGCAP